MKPPRAIDCTGPLKVGKWYEVECVQCNFRDTGDTLFLPLMGSIHSDDEDVNNTERLTNVPHLHLDMRFLNKRELKLMGFKPWNFGACFAEAGQKMLTRWERRRCLRQWAIGVPENNERRQRFEQRYSKFTLDLKNPVCPHQKFNLSTVRPIIIDGRPVLICPGHQLGWCAQTGKLVPRHPHEIRPSTL
jgi:hypothetical protein